MENELPPTCTIPRARIAVLLVLAALPVLLTAAAFPFLGDTVPVHYGSSGPEEWGPKARLFVVAVGQALYIGGAFALASPPELPVDLLELLLNGLFELIVASLVGCALYMLITGKGLAGVNFQPKPSELERSLGAPKSQARAIGALLLFLAAVVLAEWVVLFW